MAASGMGKGVFRRVAIGLPYLWLLALFLIPFLIVLKISVSTIATAIPPYTPTFGDISTWLDGIRQFTFENYLWIASDSLYITSYLESLKIAAISTVLTLAIGYPLAYGMARAPQRMKPLPLMLVILPFWTSFLIRVYAWIGILKPEGLLNQFLFFLGVIDAPLIITNTPVAIYIGIVYSYLPFMVLPIFANLDKMDGRLLEAAADLGSTPLRAFWTITFPLSLRGVLAGAFLVFIPAVGEFVIPDLLGGSRTLMIGKTLWMEFFNNRDWPVSSAVAILLLIVLVLGSIIYFNRYPDVFKCCRYHPNS